MKTNTTSVITRTGGTKGIIFETDYSKKTILFTDNGKIISIHDKYDVEPCEPHNIEGTQVSEYIENLIYHFEKWGCTWNARQEEIYQRVSLAADVQREEGRFHYNNPIYQILERVNKDPDIYRAWLSERINVKRKEAIITNYSVYGTNDERKISRIKKEWEKKAKAESRVKSKALKIKEKENLMLLKAKIKEGYTYIAFMRNYRKSKGHFSYLGETLEFRTSKPTTKRYYELTKETIKDVAKYI
jgi:hypothetical protein